VSIWQATERSLRHTPCGQVAMPFAGRAINLTDESVKPYPGRWRA
jgi:hypothetical protein